jgi:hypothetical protein
MILTPLRVYNHVLPVLPCILSGSVCRYRCGPWIHPIQFLGPWKLMVSVYASPITPRDDEGKKDDSIFLSFISVS